MAWASMRRVTPARNWSGPERKAAEAASALSSTAWPAGQWSREAWMRAVSGWASSAVESLTGRRAVSEVFRDKELLLQISGALVVAMAFFLAGSLVLKRPGWYREARFHPKLERYRDLQQQLLV